MFEWMAATQIHKNTPYNTKKWAKSKVLLLNNELT